MFVDLVFLGDFCNLQCVYCSAGRTGWRQVGGHLEGLRPIGGRTTVDLGALEARLLAIIDECAEQGVTGLKLSGGEIFVQPALATAVIDRACRRIEVVQVMTNGTRIDELCALLDTHENLFVQLSVDGATAETNRARTRDDAQTRRILANARTLARRGPLELNVVLTRWNTRALPELLTHVQSLGDDVIAYPFPVRGDAYPEPPNRGADSIGPFLPEAREAAAISARLPDLTGLDEVIDDHERWANVLPARGYLTALRAFFDQGNTRRSCEIPRAITGLNEVGRQAVCACGDLGLVGGAGTELVRPTVGAVWGDPCPGCFTHYEIVHHVQHASQARGPFTRRMVEEYLGLVEGEGNGTRSPSPGPSSSSSST